MTLDGFDDDGFRTSSQHRGDKKLPYLCSIY